MPRSISVQWRDEDGNRAASAARMGYCDLIWFVQRNASASGRDAITYRRLVVCLRGSRLEPSTELVRASHLNSQLGVNPTANFGGFSPISEQMR